jgi:hypothetical protein
MKISMHARPVSSRVVSSIITAAVLTLAAVPAFANEGGDDHSGGFGRHPTLPVPSVLIFGAVAVTAAIAASRRRKSKTDAQSKRGDDI